MPSVSGSSPRAYLCSKSLDLAAGRRKQTHAVHPAILRRVVCLGVSSPSSPPLAALAIVAIWCTSVVAIAYSHLHCFKPRPPLPTCGRNAPVAAQGGRPSVARYPRARPSSQARVREARRRTTPLDADSCNTTQSSIIVSRPRIHSLVLAALFSARCVG